MTPNVAKCLVVSKVLVADGMMTDDERTFLASMMDTLGLSPAERQSVIDLEGLDEADAIVRGLSADERREIVALLIDAAAADGRLSPHELETAKKLTTALGLDG
jgi:uncharacterized tellurite resistance protein B-like protein